MVRYISDENEVAFIYESGLYAVTSGLGQWIGLVQSNGIDESTNVEDVRFVGNSSRNVGQLVQTVKDYTGTVTYFPQDWKMLGFALGSVVDGGSPSPYTHDFSETVSTAGNKFTSGTRAPFNSFTLIDSQAGSLGTNFIRYVKGCMVDTFTLNISEGDIVSCDVDYVGQHLIYASGLISGATAVATRPFKSSDAHIQIPVGTILESVKSITYTVSNNIEATHYSNGSVVVFQPTPLNRDHELAITLDGNSPDAKSIYDNLFTGGSTFNAILFIGSTEAGQGSRDLLVAFSGCVIVDADIPTSNEGLNEWTLTVRPQTVSAQAEDLILLYNAWQI